MSGGVDTKFHHFLPCIIVPAVSTPEPPTRRRSGILGTAFGESTTQASTRHAEIIDTDGAATQLKDQERPSQRGNNFHCCLFVLY